MHSLAFLQPDTSSSQESSDRPNGDCSDRPSLVGAAVVGTSAEFVNPGTSSSAEQERSTAERSSSATSTPNVSSTAPGRISCLRQRYETESLPEKVASLHLAATRSSACKTYESSWRSCCSWCAGRKINQLSASLNDILSFLADCYEEGLQYRTINVLRSALSLIHPKIDSYCVGQHPYVINLMRDVFNSRPLRPRYAYTWDLGLVTQYLKGLE